MGKKRGWTPLERRREIRKRGHYLNEAETAAAVIFQKHSVAYVRRGYPDFIITKEGEIKGFIEVKPSGDKELRDGQKAFARFCERFGIPFMKWCPEQGEEAITEFVASLP